MRCDGSPQAELQVLISLFLPPQSFVCNHCRLPLLIFSVSLWYVPSGTARLPGTAGVSAQVY